MGVLAFRLSSHLPCAVPDRSTQRAVTMTTVLVLAAVVLVVEIGSPRRIVPHYLVAAAAFTALLLLLRVHPTRIIVNPMFIYLGKVSFSLYLLHYPVICGLMQIWPAGITAGGTQLTAPLSFLVFASVSVAVAACAYRLVEKPGQALGRSVVARRFPAQPR